MNDGLWIRVLVGSLIKIGVQGYFHPHKREPHLHVMSGRENMSQLNSTFKKFNIATSQKSAWVWRREMQFSNLPDS